MAIRKSSNSGIPFGNTSGRPSSPADGQPYFNGELQRLELYTGSQYGWQNIVAETPGVTGYSGSVVETNTTNTITITGTNFASGAQASLVGSNGTEYVATSTTVNNLTSITATFADISGSFDPYDIKVTNPSNLYGVYYDILTVNDKPVWQTASGSLGTFSELNSVSATVSATDEENNSLTYSSSNLPEWLSLNSSTGVLSGTAPSISADTTYSFNILASDSTNTSQSRAFSITILNIDGSTAEKAFSSPTIAASAGYSAGTYYFKSASMSQAEQLYFTGSSYEDGSAFVKVFSAPFASPTTLNKLGLNIPFNKFLIRRTDGAYKALVRFSSNQSYNETTGITGASGTNNIGQTAGLKVMLGGAGGHGVYNTNQSRCSWSDSTGSVGAGFDGSCGSWPDGLRWGTGTGSANYNNMNGTYDHWISW